MSVKVIHQIVKFVEDQNSDAPVSIVWHGGEPLVTGIERFKAMLEPFEALRSIGKIQHFIQTNATLITDQWCELFIHYNIRVGISIDGDKTANSARVNWSGLEAYDQIISGIGKLRDWNIPFSVIAVVGKQNIEHPADLFNFFATLGCFQLGINIEEQEGLNDSAIEIASDSVRNFWRELFTLWKSNPVINIREFRQFLRFASLTIDKDEDRWTSAASNDMLPTIGWSGDVILLSPEFSGVESAQYADFIVGNIIEESLASILLRQDTIPYVMDFREGVNNCRNSCRFFAFCGGGQASNKFFENGDLKTTQTTFCLNSKQLLAEGVIMALKGG